ncbi:amino acid/amide ABC transporter substrate-binding protein, HAAT family [Noviherbaspirillum humi]|uniref:Amino acid/amide ABC transporter substrate-binding protein, HAAT family n=1 Tax=Noviherbaspirillum humi TaxID=1688639 RepID=A0A239CGL2_9BURK|nr:ABC transporter substrate-binding protein [Noviherbaspirillum humi]SNS19012.1 amino acid/amide ABC transporter substrate-binding protein, HAAT family [Noviherbaspirillum humi]
MVSTWRACMGAFAMLACVATAAAAEDGVTESSILIGQTVGVTGTVAGPVREMNEGALAYFNQVNKNGGVFGRKIELRTLDDKFDPALTLANAETLIRKERVFALFQTRGTPHTQGILPLLAENKVPLIAPSTGAVVFHQPVNRWVFNIRAKYQDEVGKAVEHFSTIGLNSIALLHVNDAYGEDGREGFVKAMAARKLEPTLVTPFDRVKPDYDAAAARLIKANPQAVIIVSSAANTVGAIKAIRAQGGRMQIMTLSNNSSQAFVKDLGAAGAGVIVSQITPAPHLISTPLGQEFKKAATAEGVTISYAAMEGYVNAKVLVEGLRRAGRNLTREGFVNALESLQRTDLGGLLVTYGAADHTGSEFVELTMIGKDGRFIR